jgi:hypothetical protein
MTDTIIRQTPTAFSMRLKELALLTAVGLVTIGAIIPSHAQEIWFINVFPQSVDLVVGQSQQFTGECANAAGGVIPGYEPAWTTSGGSIGPHGLYTATTPGDFWVNAAAGMVAVSRAYVHVAPPLARIVVTPAEVTVSPLGWQWFAAVGYDAMSNTVPITPVWSGGRGSYIGDWSGYISQDGIYSAPYWPGDYVVTARSGDVSGSAVVHVSRVMSSVVVSPCSVALQLGQQQQFAAHGVDQIGSPMAVTVSWQASGGSISQDGLFTATAPGDFTVTASGGGWSGTANVHVSGILSQIQVRPADTTLLFGGQRLFTAVGYDAASNTVPITPAWTATGGSIDQTGLYTATNYGDFSVTASADTNSGSSTVHVRFGISRCEYQAASSFFTLSWASLATRVYEVYQTTNLANPEWQLVAPLLAATPPLNTWSNTVSAGNPAVFYRVLERDP